MREGRCSAPRVRPRRRIWVSARRCVTAVWLFFLTRAYRENALIIHYTRNDHLLRDGELVLIDAGGEYKCAASIS